jgi:hypothetical protein
MAATDPVAKIAEDLRAKLIVLEAELAFLGPDEAGERAGYEAQIAEVRRILATLGLAG